MREGGCLCGAIRYVLTSEPFDTGWCHCRQCQLSSGSPAMVFTTVPVNDFELIAGEDALCSVASSAFGERSFCGRCGTPLTMQVTHEPETIDVTAASLDRPDEIAPEYHIFIDERIAWATIADGLPRHPRGAGKD